MTKTVLRELAAIALLSALMILFAIYFMNHY
jgi:hypothetical protein